MNVVVIGGSNCSKKNYNIAKDLGNLIAQEGWTLICGGGFGVMEAVCKGAKEKGGLTVGILPGYRAEDANSYLDVKIPTGLGYARNIVVVRSSEIVIAIDGKEGTLSEIAFALNEKKYVIGINTWDIKGVIKVKTVHQAIAKIRKLKKQKISLTEL